MKILLELIDFLGRHIMQRKSIYKLSIHMT